MPKHPRSNLEAIVKLTDDVQDDGRHPILVFPDLSARQGESLVFLFEYFVSMGFYPTQRELLEHLGVHGTAAAVYLDPLVRKGYVVRQPDERRNIRLTDRALVKLERMGVDVWAKLDAVANRQSSTMRLAFERSGR